jgi:nitrogen fixation protein FixH
MKRGAWWPIGITAVLATTVAANIWVMMIANDDPSFAIEPDYYRKAVAWDSTLAQARESARLGWRLTPSLAPIPAAGGSRLSARLTDSTGTPIQGATIRVSARHVARASDVHDVALVASGSGEYAGSLDARRPGQWELRFDVRAGAAHYTEVARVDAYLAR